MARWPTRSSSRLALTGIFADWRARSSSGCAPGIDALSDNPHPHGASKLKGADELWRIRVGDYRIVYEIHHRVLLVLVVRVAHRREAYR